MQLENIELDKSKLDSLHSRLLNDGLGYEYQKGNHLVPPETSIIGSHNLGLSGRRIADIQAAHRQWLNVAHTTLSTQEGHQLIKSLLADDDRKKLELDHYQPSKPLYSNDNGYITSANLTRIDHLYDGNGNILGCDPNLVPLGAAYAHAYTEGVGNIIDPNTLLGSLDVYEQRLARIATSDKQRISGIVTSTKYPLWRMHLYMTNLVRERYDVPMYVIPPEAIDQNSGQVDLKLVKGLYERLGIKLADMDNLSQAGALIRYCRELPKIANPDVRVINPAGLRIMESQLWNALISLPGYNSYHKRLTGQETDLDLHRSTYIPSSLIRVYLTDAQIATSIDDNGQITWEMDTTKLPGFEDLMKIKGTRPNYQGYLKTLSTSGNKGARKISEKRAEIVPSMNAAYLDIYHISPPGEGTVMLVQPYIRSISSLYGDEPQSHRIDIYLSGMDHALMSAASCNTPYVEKAHGGSNATYGLVYDTQKLYPDFDFDQNGKNHTSEQPINGNDIKEALGIEGGPIIRVLLEQIGNYSKARYLEGLLQVKEALSAAGIVITPKQNYETQQIVAGMLDNVLKGGS